MKIYAIYIKLLITVFVMTCYMALVTFAGSWGKDSEGWWYLNDDGTYATSGWIHGE